MNKIKAHELTVESPRELTETEWDAISGGAASAAATNTGNVAVATAGDGGCFGESLPVTIGFLGGNCAGAGAA